MSQPNFPSDSGTKSFWKKPEGTTGLIFLVGLLGAAGYLLVQFLPALIALTSNILALAGMLLVLGVILYVALDPKARALVGYMYKSMMRKITGIFVTIDPIGILKNYVEDLEDNLAKMSKQIGNIRGQMRKIKTLLETNDKDIDKNLAIARKAKEKGMQKEMMLSSRKAARLKETNGKYASLYKRMEILNRVLVKMYQNSEILLEDTKDQVKLKEQERKAIRASHSAMKSAMSIISGDSDKRAMFDQALEHIADDVANKIGEMERFMEMSDSFMNSVDLQNAGFEEQGLQMLEQWEKQSTLLLMGDSSTTDTLDLDALPREREAIERKQDGNYNKLFD